MSLKLAIANEDGINGGFVASLSGGLSALTISAWVRLTSLNDGQYVADKGPDGSNHWGMQASVSGEAGSNDVRCNLKNGGSASTQYGYTTDNLLSADGEFHHWCMVFDGSGANNSERLKFYFDGVEKSLTYAGNIPATTYPWDYSYLYLGRALWDTGVFFDGTLEDVRFYTSALSDDDVETIYNGDGEDDINDNLVIRYPMNEKDPGEIPPGPSILSTTETSFSNNSVNHPVQMPATVGGGYTELLLMHIAVKDGSLDYATPNGWNQLWVISHSSLNYAGYYRIADGTEGGTTVNVVSSSAGNGAAQVFRIKDTSFWTTWTNPSKGVSPVPNPPQTVLADPAQTLWLALSGATDDDVNYTAPPSGFTNLLSTLSGGGSNDSAEVGSARLLSGDVSVNPSSFTLASSEVWAAVTIAIEAAKSIAETATNFYTQATPINTPEYDESRLS